MSAQSSPRAWCRATRSTSSWFLSRSLAGRSGISRGNLHVSGGRAVRKARHVELSGGGDSRRREDAETKRDGHEPGRRQPFQSPTARNLTGEAPRGTSLHLQALLLRCSRTVYVVVNLLPYAAVFAVERVVEVWRRQAEAVRMAVHDSCHRARPSKGPGPPAQPGPASAAARAERAGPRHAALPSISTSVAPKNNTSISDPAISPLLLLDVATMLPFARGPGGARGKLNRPQPELSVPLVALLTRTRRRQEPKIATKLQSVTRKRACVRTAAIVVGCSPARQHSMVPVPVAASLRLPRTGNVGRRVVSRHVTYMISARVCPASFWEAQRFREERG